MVETKILEVRDQGTFIPVLAVNMNSVNPVHAWFLRRMGYPNDGRPNVGITRLDANGGPFWNDPFGWSKSARTIPTAHELIIAKWNELRDGDVVCVETILGERQHPKISERLTT
jgi:hypothetical protein